MKDSLEAAAALVAVIVAVSGWMRAGLSLKSENAAKSPLLRPMTAQTKQSRATAQDALDMAKLATAALEGIKLMAVASSNVEKARLEAPAILELWVSHAMNDERDPFKGSYSHGPLMDLSSWHADSNATMCPLAHRVVLVGTGRVGASWRPQLVLEHHAVRAVELAVIAPDSPVALAIGSALPEHAASIMGDRAGEDFGHEMVVHPRPIHRGRSRTPSEIAARPKADLRAPW